MTNKQQFKVEWYAWRNMKARCQNKNLPNYHRYGGRGIKVCERWLGKNGFDNFIEDMGLRPNEKYTLDRIDNNGDYSPYNCRWATVKTQSNNQQRNIVIEHRGTKKTLAEWADYTGMNYDQIRARYRNGWSVKEILENPNNKYRKERKITNRSHVIEYNGESLTMSQWAKRLGCSYDVIRSRVRYGWEPKRIIETPVPKSKLYNR